MPRKAKQVSQSEAQRDEAQLVEPINEAQRDQRSQPNEVRPTQLTKDDYLKARETIKNYREAQKAKPKRPCSDKQLAALAAGRARNKRFANKTTGENQ